MPRDTSMFTVSELKKKKGETEFYLIVKHSCSHLHWLTLPYHVT